MKNAQLGLSSLYISNKRIFFHLLSIIVLPVIFVLFTGCEKEYNQVKIGDQIWMTENLNVDHFQNGDIIPEVKTNAEWSKAVNACKPAWCYYENNPENGKKYGKIYNWYAVADKRGLAPKGWHIPTSAEFNTLMQFVKNDGNSLKATGEGIEAGAGTNKSGFSALLVGYRSGWGGKFAGLGDGTCFWCFAETGGAIEVFLFKKLGNVIFGQPNNIDSFSARCIKDK